jgi:AcrR family transcriptional regulator
MRMDVAKADVRDAIMDAAERLLSLYGYSKTTVDDIAQEAGIGKGTIYLHFHGKEEIAVSFIDRVNLRIREQLEEIAVSDVSVAQKIRQMLITRVMVRLESARNHDKSIDELMAAIRPLLISSRKRWHEAESELFARVLREGRANGDFDVDDDMMTARMLLLATNALLPYSLCTRQLGERDEIEQTIGQIAELLLNGLLSR